MEKLRSEIWKHRKKIQSTASEVSSSRQVRKKLEVVRYGAADLRLDAKKNIKCKLSKHQDVLQAELSQADSILVERR